MLLLSHVTAQAMNPLCSSNPLASVPCTQGYLCSFLQPLLALWRVPAGPDPFPLPRLLLLLHDLPANPPPGPSQPHVRLGTAATCQGSTWWSTAEHWLSSEGEPVEQRRLEGPRCRRQEQLWQGSGQECHSGW